MGKKYGLQVFNEEGEAYLDLTSAPTLYLGVIDIYPTNPTGECSGEITGIRLSEDYRYYRLFFSMEKIYVNNIDFYDGNNYTFPGISDHFDDNTKEVYFTWGYASRSIFQVNVPVRIRFGVC